MRISSTYRFVLRGAVPQRSPGFCLPWLTVLLGIFLIVPQIGYAQSAEAELQALIEGMSELSPPSPDSPLPETTTTPVNLEVQWRLWRQVIKEGQTGYAELQALRHDAMSLGLPSLPTRHLAVIATARNASQLGLDEAQAEELLESAHNLAPHLPYASWEIASNRLRNGPPTEAYRAIPPYLIGISKAANWLDTRVGWALKGSVILLIAATLSFVLFIFAQMMRYFGIAAYDGTRFLPRGFSSTQTVIVLLAIVLVPGLLLQSPLLAMLILLCLLLPFQQINERAISLIFLVLLASLPTIDGYLGKLLIYPGSKAQELLHAHYHGCRPDCPPWLEDEANDNEVAAYVWAVHRFRQADQNQMKDLGADLAAWQSSSAFPAAWANLHGTTLIAQGNSRDAIPLLDRAIAADPKAPEPWFNQMRAYQILGDSEESQYFLAGAIERDLTTISRQLKTTRRDPQSYLMVQTLGAEQIWGAYAPSASDAPSLITPFWTFMAGEKIKMDLAPIMALVGILILFLSLPLYLQRKLSSPCPKCALARDPVDAEKSNHHHYCLPCYQTFVSGASLEYRARIHSETSLGRRDRFQGFLRQFFSLVTPGVGHIIGGHAIRGTLTFTALITGILLLVYPMGLWRIPYELFRQDWAGQTVFAWALISIAISAGLTGAYRGIEPTRRSTQVHRHRRRN